MSFAPEEICEALKAIPENSFLNSSAQQQAEWVGVLLENVETPKDHHAIEFYVGVARLLAEKWGSMANNMYNDGDKEQVAALIKVGDLPFASEKSPWTGFTVTGAARSLALSFVDCIIKIHAPASVASASTASAPGDISALVQNFIEAQRSGADLNKVAELLQAQSDGVDKKTAVLSFDLQDRLKAVGLNNLAEFAVPTEEAMIDVEKLAKTATRQSRPWIGSSEGEDLMMHFRPPWSRTPDLNILPAGERNDWRAQLRGAMDDRRNRSTYDKINFVSWATFQSHILVWGVEMVTLKAFELIDLTSYQFVLCNISEEHGGGKTSFYYDLFNRKRMARAIELGKTDMRPFLRELHDDTLKDAQRKVAAQLSDMARDAAAQKGKGKGKGKVDKNQWPQNPNEPNNQRNNGGRREHRERSRTPPVRRNRDRTPPRYQGGNGGNGGKGGNGGNRPAQRPRGRGQ
jgi:hypothetical protein